MQLFKRRRSDGDGSVDVPGYRDLDHIGRGGFSVVYRARQEAFDRWVALKVLTVPFDENAQRRFSREVRMTASLTGHPNVVTALDTGVTRGGLPYLAMDLYDRGSLMDRLQAEGPLPAADVAGIGAKIADALEAAHQVGIVHRDVKPSNILVSRFGEPALADFGVSSAIDGHASATILSTFTLSHAAPEVVNRETPNAASDIYALGSTMYQLLAGWPAFGGQGEETVATIRRILTEEPPALTCTELPGLVDIVMRSMAKRPEDRYVNAAALASALRGLLSGAEPASLPAPPASAESPTGPVGEQHGPGAPAPPDGAGHHAAHLPPWAQPGYEDRVETGLPPGRVVSETPRTRRGKFLKTVGAAVGAVVTLAALSFGVASWQHSALSGGQPQGQASPASVRQGGPDSVTPASTSAGGPVAPANGVPGAVLPPNGNAPAPAAEPSVAQPPPPQGAPTRPAAPPPAGGSPEQASSVCTPDGCAARASFTASGDHLYVCDNKADGHSAVAVYQRSDAPGQNNEAWDNNGSGTCVDHNMNMPEGAKITFKVCIGDYDARRILTCSNNITSTS